VDERRTGLAGAILALHGMMRLPGSLWGVTWGLYTELSALALCFSAVSGFYFWWVRAPVRRLGWLLPASATGTLGSMIWIVR